MYGFKVLGTAVGMPEIRSEVAGGTIAAGDPVMFSSGAIVIATAGSAIEGVALEAAVSSGTIRYVTGERLRVLADNDNDSTTFAATHEGTCFDMIGTTGAVQVDTSSTGATGQLRCIKYNPQGYGLQYDSDTSIGLFEVNERA